MNALHAGVLSPNDLFLIAACSGSHVDAELAAWLRDPAFSWERALEQAASNRIAASAARLALSAPAASLLDAGLQRRWSELRDAAARRTEMAGEELRRAVRAMASRNVVPLLYKGLDFAALCYPEGVARSFNDIDVIVRGGDAEAAASALAGEGYALPPGTPSFDYFRRFHLHAIFLDHDRRRLPIELHWALESPHAGLPDPLPLFFDRAEPDPAFAGVLRPHPVDALALMAGHLDKHLGLSATLPTREARLESVIEGHGLLWVLDIVLWLRARGAGADGDVVQARMRELGAEAALVTSLRLAQDLAPEALPDWARALADRLPGPPPLISRVVYPDLHRGGPPTERARRMRAWGFRTLPEVGFAPISALTALLPGISVPGTETPAAAARLAALPAKLYLLAANAVAVVRWRVDRWRSERRARLAAGAPGVPSDRTSE